MHIDYGIKMESVHPTLQKILPVVDLIFYENGQHMIVKATDYGRDYLRDAHKEGRAIDLELPLTDPDIILYRIKKTLGLTFWVTRFPTHFHLEYTPESAKGLPEVPV
jgi:hypothetical protein